jgi:hypothetical protein
MRDESMSKPKTKDPDLSEKYDFSKGERGVHYARAKKGMRFVIVTDDEDQVRKTKRDRPLETA